MCAYFFIKVDVLVFYFIGVTKYYKFSSLKQQGNGSVCNSAKYAKIKDLGSKPQYPGEKFGMAVPVPVISELWDWGEEDHRGFQVTLLEALFLFLVSREDGEW